jgi:hypothetical protein
MADSEAVAEARVIYEQLQAEHLARTPLSAMAEWVASGSPPLAEVLRAAGFAGPETAHLTDADPYRWARKTFLREWGYSIPCHEAVDALRTLGPTVEVGCGTGYWTALLRNAGLDVIATDAEAGPSAFGFRIGRHADAEQLPALEAARKYPNRAVFCSWPSPGEPWATEMMSSLAPGRLAALILHDTVATTGDAALIDLLIESFEPLGDIRIPQFPGIPDRLLIYRRRR